MLPDREYQKSNQSLLPQPRRYSRMREELEIMKNVSLVETIFLVLRLLVVLHLLLTVVMNFPAGKGGRKAKPMG